MRRLALLALCIACAGFATAASGETLVLEPEQPAGDAVLKVAPDRYEKTIKPGTPYEGVIYLFNIGTEPVRVQAEVSDMRVPDGGVGIEFPERGDDSTFARYVTVDTQAFRIRAGEAQRLPFRIDIPKSVDLGGSFGAILFRVLPVKSDAPAGVVRQSARLGTLFVLAGADAPDPSASFTAFDERTGLLGSERRFSAAFRNDGAVDGPTPGPAIHPRGTVTVTNLFGRDVATSSFTGGTLLPGGSAALDKRLERRFWFGRYTATVRLYDGKDRDTIASRTLTFWAVSPWAVVTLGLLGVIIAAATIYGVRRRRAYWERWADEDSDEDSLKQ